MTIASDTAAGLVSHCSVVESDLQTSGNWAHAAEFLQGDVQTKPASLLLQDEALTGSDVRAFFQRCEGPLQASAFILNTNGSDFWVIPGSSRYVLG